MRTGRYRRLRPCPKSRTGTLDGANDACGASHTALRWRLTACEKLREVSSAWIRSRLLRLGLAAVVIAFAVAGVAAALPEDDAPAARASGRPQASVSAGCGAEAAAAAGAVDATVARGIYTDELRGKETREDVGRVTNYAPLLAALAAHRAAAVQSAVSALVYMPRWHIVRLRVTAPGMGVADVGGPYIIAPVSGTLRQGGRVLGHYVLSVQDDLGYQKLVTRFIGTPIDLYRGGSLVMGTLPAVKSPPSDGAIVSAHGVLYRAVTMQTTAFPSGPLQTTMFVAAGSQRAGSCAAVRLASWGSIATHIAARLQPLPTHYPQLAAVLRAVTGGRVFVRSGARALAGGAGPARLPAHGSVRFGGRSWPVFSWEPAPSQRVYFLTPG